jgi:hypothetical protein
LGGFAFFGDNFDDFFVILMDFRVGVLFVVKNSVGNLRLNWDDVFYDVFVYLLDVLDHELSGFFVHYSCH